jgi:K+-sensing histidine kinase KdpD
MRTYAYPPLGKVFSNLVDNSLKYGQKVTRIQIYAEKGRNHMAIWFEDNRGGIPEEEKECIFMAGFGKSTGYGMFLASEILVIT